MNETGSYYTIASDFKSRFVEMFGGDLIHREELSSLCSTFIDGDWIESKDQSGTGIRLIQTGNVGCCEYKDKGDKAKFITDSTFERLHCTEVLAGDILISRLPDPVGRACIVPDGLGKCITAVDCTIIRLNNQILPTFFVAYTNTPEYQSQIKGSLAGTTRLRISRGNLGKIKIPIPPMEQQEQFVRIANQADKSVFELKKSIAAIDLDYRILFQQAQPNQANVHPCSQKGIVKMGKINYFCSSSCMKQTIYGKLS